MKTYKCTLVNKKGKIIEQVHEMGLSASSVHFGLLMLYRKQGKWIIVEINNK